MADGGKCNNKNCKVIVTEIRKKDGQYKKYCSTSCRRLGVAEKCKQTSIEKYGVSNPAKSKEVNMERYGVTNPSLVPAFIQKIKDTNRRQPYT